MIYDSVFVTTIHMVGQPELQEAQTVVPRATYSYFVGALEFGNDHSLGYATHT